MDFRTTSHRQVNSILMRRIGVLFWKTTNSVSPETYSLDVTPHVKNLKLTFPVKFSVSPRIFIPEPPRLFYRLPHNPFRQTISIDYLTCETWTRQDEVENHGNVDMEKIAESQLDRKEK